ncbi:hypothetical protein LSH36_674g01038 [Paralvinella palmiformis]|uniref:C2H2-type domain-containing protein n=1 Tax=Paralvinella palmiformis TaxID=53620 RepID=A0AAD9J4M2_9ANNE|nr:hypothetical protein LSH36_674g01038 [Paralvinella palmiformis]
MIDDGKGEEVEDQNLDIQEAALADSESAGGSPDPDGPSVDGVKVNNTEKKCDASEMSNEKETTSSLKDKHSDRPEKPREIVIISNQPGMIVSQEKTSQLQGESINGIVKNLTQSAEQTDVRESGESVGVDGAINLPPLKCHMSQLSCSKEATISKYDQDRSECSPPHLTQTAAEVLRVPGSERSSASSKDDEEETKDMPRLYPIGECPSSEPTAANKGDAVASSHREGGKPKDGFIHRMYPEHRMRSHRDHHDRPRHSKEHHRNHYRDTESRHKHHIDSYKFHPELDHFSPTSLAKKYADLFSNVKSESRKAPIKEEKLSSPVCTSYEPLRGIADMVKAAEHRSPTTPHGTYHSKFAYMKGMSASPSSLDSLHRIADKDRSSSETRPSVVQSMNNAYQKYLPLSASHRECTTPCTADNDPDKPLDLSIKNKDNAESESSKKKQETAYVPYLSPHTETTAASSSSTLASLEKKFGEDSFMFERIGTKQFNTPIRQFYMSAFGMGIYSTALNNSYPFPASHPMSAAPPTQSQTLQANSSTSSRCSLTRNESPLRKSSGSGTSTVHGEDSSKSYVPSKFLEQAIKDSKSDLKKHTNLQCSCGAEFETLYQLTLHLQETGHPANATKNGTHHDYPKLVRGQDMWLNHGSEQTKQILRCMQCGESFKSLPELTVHMIQTKHYTNIVGTEPQGKTLKSTKSSMSTSDCSDTESTTHHRCHKCKELFDDAESLSQHQEKSGHITPKCEPGTPKADFTPPRPTSAQSDRDTTGSGMTHSSSNGSIMHFKRRLLESLGGAPDVLDEDSRDSSFSSHSASELSRIRCENCSEKIRTEHFVEHVRQCVKNLHSPRPTRSCNHSPMEYKEYLNGEFHLKKEPCDLDVKSPGKSAKTTSYAEESFKYYQEFMCHSEEKARKRKIGSQDIGMEADNSRNTPRDYCTVHSSTELINPADDATDGASALKAMESFIERSFAHKSARKPVQSTSLFASSLFGRNFFAQQPQVPTLTAESTKHVTSLSPFARRETPSPQKNTSHLYQNKYLPPFYETSSHGSSSGGVDKDSRQTPPPCITPKKEQASSPRPNENGEIMVPDKNDNTVVGRNTPPRKRNRDDGCDEFRDSAEKISPVKKNFKDQYLQAQSIDETTTDSSTQRSTNSALQSLQGLVYGKSFNTEHPLDSLQKLIHTTSSTSASQTVTTSQSSFSPPLISCCSNSGGLPTTLPGTVILVNPIVTVIANSKSSSPSLQISMPPGGPSSPDSKELHSPHADCSSHEKSPTPEGDGDQNSEYRCAACNRNFASKGSYRYHLSRCHWSTVKKYRIKEAINTSPYIYLPLDHMAKFNKYYEMANELANKGK